MKKKRVFLAFTLGPIEHTTIKLKKLQEQLRTYRIKWGNTDNYHVTLFFFGELPTEQIDLLLKLLSENLKEASAFTFSFSKPGIFKNRKEPRILWLGIEVSGQLFDLKKQIDKTTNYLGLTPDQPPFRPHLTLGRFAPYQKTSKLLYNALNDFQNNDAANYAVSELILFESKLSSGGAKYFPLATFPLKDTNT